MIHLRTVFIVGLTVTATAIAGTSATSNTNPKQAQGLQGIGPDLTDRGDEVTDASRRSLEPAFYKAFPGAQLIKVRGQLRRAFGRTFGNGIDPHASVETFLRSWSNLWKVPFDQLQPVGPFENGSHMQSMMTDAEGQGGYIGVYWAQQVRGVPVFRSYVWGLVGDQENYPLVLAGGTLKDLGEQFPATLDGRDLGSSSMDINVYTSKVMTQFDAPPELTTPRYVIWAGVDTDAVSPRLSVEFTATAGDPSNPSSYRKMLYVTDAADGTVLHEESLILHGSVSGNVSGKVTDAYKADACNAEVTRGLPYASVPVGGVTTYADVNGNYSATYTGTASVTVAPTLKGKYFTVLESTGSANLATVTSVSVANGGTANFVFNSTPTAIKTAQTNCYYEANKARDQVLAVSPSYPTINSQTSFSIYTNIADSCNAYYDGGSINFFQAGGGCNNTGFSTVVHHEYGHHMVNRGGSGQGAYGEGMGDVLAVLVSDEYLLGVGFSSCTSGIRTASNACSYSASNCSTCGSEIHACGQLISGVVWDLRNSYLAAYPSDSRTRVAKLAVNSVMLHSGQSDIGADIAADYLTLDDAVSNGGNANIADGTPNYNIISAAFNRHGLSSPSLALFLIEFPNGQPTTIDPAGGLELSVDMRPVASQVVAGSEKMFYRIGNSGAFTMTPLTKISGVNYKVTLPAVACGGTLEYYFQGSSTGGTIVTSPTDAPSTFYSAASELDSSIAFEDDFDGVMTEFTVAGTASPSRGSWVRLALTNTNSCNAPTLFAGSYKSYVTGAVGPTCNDIDTGYTELVSPIFSAVGAQRLEFSVNTYLSNDTGAYPGEDPLTIFASSDGGLTYEVLDTIYSTHNWTTRTYNIEEFTSITNQMRVKVRAEDLGAGDSQVKAAIDFIKFRSLQCTPGPFGDLDGDLTVGSGDLAILLLDFGPCPGCPADLDGNAEVDNGDVAVLLLSYTD